MNAISLIDLDDSIFGSKRKCPAGAHLSPAAVDRNGNWHSFLTPQQAAFVDMINAGSLVVPVTAREIDGFRRVKMRFTSYAITSFGAVILTPGGELEPEWHAYIKEQSDRAAQEVETCLITLKRLAEREGVDARVYIISDAGMPLYVNAKHNGRNVDELKTLAFMLNVNLPDGWKLHLNGNNLAAMPAYIGKEYAVDYYLKNLAPPHSFVLGLGDSFTDLGFMGLCDYAITPTRGQVFDHLRTLQFASPHVAERTSKGKNHENNTLVA